MNLNLIIALFITFILFCVYVGMKCLGCVGCVGIENAQSTSQMGGGMETINDILLSLEAMGPHE
jgi:hypothetical protein